MAGYISAASTSKIGEGDAFVYDNSGANRNIGILARQKAQQDENAAQAAAAKKKQDYDTQKGFYDNLSTVNTLGMRTIDLPEVTNGIDDILKYTNDLKMQGKNPLDINNVQEYMQLQGKLAKIQATADISKTLQKQLVGLEKTLASDKLGMYDQAKGYQLAHAGYTAPLSEMQGASFELPLAEYSLIPQLDKVTGDNLKTLFSSAKVLNDKGAVEDVNKMLGAGKQSYIQSAISLAGPAIAQGRISQEKVIKDAADYFDYNAKSAVYNANKDEDQILAQTKADRQEKHNKVMEELGYGRLKVAQRNASSTEKKVAQSETVPLNIRSVVDDVVAGSTNAIKLLNAANIYNDGEEAEEIVEIVQGDGRTLKNPATGNSFIASPNQKFIVIKNSDGSIKWQPTDEKALQSFVDSKTGTNLNKYVQVDAVGNNKSVKPVALGTKEQPTVGSKNSTSSSTKSKTSSGSSSSSSGNSIPTITTKAQFDALPKGSSFIRNGQKYKKD